MRVAQVLIIQCIWISKNFAQDTIFQDSYYSFQTIGTDEFPPELESAGKFPSTIFPARLTRQNNDFGGAPESAQNSIFQTTEVQSNDFRNPSEVAQTSIFNNALAPGTVSIPLPNPTTN